MYWFWEWTSVRVYLWLTVCCFTVRACAWNNKGHLFGYNIDSQSETDSCLLDGDGNQKFCNVRGALLPRSIWNHWTGFFCYNYTNDYRLRLKYNVTYPQVACNNQLEYIPVTVLENGTWFWYDFTHEPSLPFIRLTFKNEIFFNLWESCCREAVDCCENSMNNSNIYGNVEYPCPAIWDAWTCFAPAKAGSIAKMPCSDQAYSTSSKICVIESQKECFPNGTWNQKTNYEVCALAPILRGRHNFHVILLSTAIALSLPAVIIFFSFRKFRITTRFCLHRNLILIIIIRNVLTIMSKEFIILDALKPSGSNGIMDDNGVACRVLAFFENAAKNGIYACMLVDGFYLHKLIVRSFADEPKLVYLYGTVVVVSLLPSLIWASVRGSREATDCWMIDDTTGDQWISDGFRLAILAINTLLLLDIVRNMILKLKMGSTSQQAKTTFRATLFLLPLFGLHIIITANRGVVTSDTCYAESVFYYVSYTLEAIQGIVVAFLFCYLSAEVHGEMKNGYRKFSIYIQQTYGVELRRDTLFRRRTTAATYVDQGGLEEDNKTNYLKTVKKLNREEDEAVGNKSHLASDKVNRLNDESEM